MNPALLNAISEKAFQQQVIHYARLKGFLVYHTLDSRGSQPGFPDLVMVRDGRLIFAELKRQAGAPGRHQRAWLRELEGTPAETYLWRPSDWPDIEKALA